MTDQPTITDEVLWAAQTAYENRDHYAGEPYSEDGYAPPWPPPPTPSTTPPPSCGTRPTWSR